MWLFSSSLMKIREVWRYILIAETSLLTWHIVELGCSRSSYRHTLVVWRACEIWPPLLRSVVLLFCAVLSRKDGLVKFCDLEPHQRRGHIDRTIGWNWQIRYLECQVVHIHW